MKRYFKNYKYSWGIIGLILYLSFFTPPKMEMDEITNIDKLAHICMYGGLCTIIWWEYWRKHHVLSLIRTIIGAIVLPIALSGAIELLQEYVTENRSGDWADMIANTIGVLLAALLGYFGFSRLKR
ncbi:MAG: VanZ family protein [Bacteroidaceae bacterium]|nr:VanZ family protein [Bacteroidaceae bacterium]